MNLKPVTLDPVVPIHSVAASDVFEVMTVLSAPAPRNVILFPAGIVRLLVQVTLPGGTETTSRSAAALTATRTSATDAEAATTVSAVLRLPQATPKTKAQTTILLLLVAMVHLQATANQRHSPLIIVARPSPAPHAPKGAVPFGPRGRQDGIDRPREDRAETLVQSEHDGQSALERKRHIVPRDIDTLEPVVTFEVSQTVSAPSCVDVLTIDEIGQAVPRGQLHCLRDQGVHRGVLAMRQLADSAARTRKVIAVQQLYESDGFVAIVGDEKVAPGEVR